MSKAYRNRLLAFLLLLAGPGVTPYTVGQNLASLGQEFHLANGMRVLLADDSGRSAQAEALLVVRAGTEQELPGQEGVADLAAEAFVAEDEIQKQLARNGILLEYGLGKKFVAFRFSMPAQRALPFIALLGQILSRGPLSPEVWDEARAKRRQAVRQEEESPWEYGVSRLTELAWQGGGADERSSHLAPGVKDHQRDALQDFLTRNYLPGQMVFCMWGAIPAAAVKEALTLSDAGPSRPPLPPQPSPARIRPANNGATECAIRPGAEPPLLVMGQGIRLSDDREFYGWQALAQILGGSATSRLHRRLRLEEQLVYTVEAACLPVGESGLTLRIGCQGKDVRRVSQIIREELRRLATRGVSREELRRAVAILKSRALLDREADGERFYRRAATLLSSERMRDPAAAEKFLDGLTPKELLSLARRSLRPARLVTVIVSEQVNSLCPSSGDDREG
jgi:predicted Zn-dependent peptidase